eukprot:scaffold135519_cov81-Cyclotella_meneghiniana.AAC.3
MAEWSTTKAFTKDVTKLVMCIDFNHDDVAWANLFTKPMIFDGIMFGARGHALWFQTSKC